jgi:biotin operon repressor
MDAKKRKPEPLLEYLLTTSPDKPVPWKVVCEKFGIKRRGLRQRVQSFRARGYPILSDKNGAGYYLELREKELDLWLRTYLDYANTIQEVAKEMKEGAKRLHEAGKMA